MNSDPTPDPIRSLVEQIQRLIEWACELIRSGQWSTLLLLIIVVLFALFVPENGLIYKSLYKTFPEQYSIVFWSTLAFLFGATLLLKILKLDKPIPPKWLKFSASIVTTIAIIFVLRNILSGIPKSPAKPSLQDNFSWGEEFLIKEIPKCKNQKDNGTKAYMKHDYQEAEDSYSQYVKECQDGAEPQIYLNNARARQKKNFLKIAVSVPITRKDGEKDSQEILRGVALAQNEWNEKNIDKNLLVEIADDGYGNGDGDCGSNHDQGECQKAQDIAKKLADQNDIVGVIGHFSSDATQAASKIYENKLVAISPTSTTIRSNSQCSEKYLCLNSYIFRTAPNDSIAVKRLIERIPPNITRIAIVYEGNSTYSRFYKATFTEEFKRQQTEDAIVNFNDDSCNFSRKRSFEARACLEAAKNGGANALLLIPSAKNADKIKDVLNYNFFSQNKFPLLGSDSMYKLEFIKDENQGKTENMLVSVPWHRSDDSCEDSSNRLECKAAKLLSSKEKASSSPEIKNPSKINWRTAMAYDATQALLMGLKIASEQKCNSWGFNIFGRDMACLRRELNDVLLNLQNVETKVRFDKQGDRKDDELGVVVKVHNGQFTSKW